MRILKFGGTSLANAERINRAAAIVAEAAKASPVAAVVSAMGGVTDALSQAADAAASGAATPVSIDDIEKRHLDAIAGVSQEAEHDALETQVRDAMTEVRSLLQGVSLVGECSPRTRDRILSHGERLSARFLAAALRNLGTEATAHDATSFVVTDSRFGAALVQMDSTEERVRSRLAVSDVPVITGFIGANDAGEVTTLGRGGSDLTASVLGACVNAERVEIWTDVDGLMSADPTLVPDAFPLPAVTYDELMELSHFGARIIYPPTVHPARQRGIPIVIRNTMNPEHPGTVVSPEAVAGNEPVRGVSSINRVAMLRLEGDGMVGVPGIAARLFATLARAEINIILISQASSEHSICFAVLPEDAARARLDIETEFVLERGAGLINDVIVEEPYSVLAVVGTGMRERAGIAGRIFSVLGDGGINVRAIAQGSSELSISLVLASADEAAALQAIHGAFFQRAET